MFGPRVPQPVLFSGSHHQYCRVVGSHNRYRLVVGYHHPGSHNNRGVFCHSGLPGSMVSHPGWPIKISARIPMDRGSAPSSGERGMRHSCSCSQSDLVGKLRSMRTAHGCACPSGRRTAAGGRTRPARRQRRTPTGGGIEVPRAASLECSASSTGVQADSPKGAALVDRARAREPVKRSTFQDAI